MRNPAPVLYPVHDLVKMRWSPRAHDGKAVSRDELATLCEAARWAPSSFNEQPWRFLVAPRDDEAGFAALFECLTPPNRRWADKVGALIVVTAKRIHDCDGLPNRYAEHDIGIALGVMSLQAAALDLAFHIMGGFDRAAIALLCGIPNGYEPISMASVGHVGLSDTLPADLETRETAPRRRKPFNEVVFGPRWGSPFPQGSAQAGAVTSRPPGTERAGAAMGEGNSETTDGAGGTTVRSRDPYLQNPGVLRPAYPRSPTEGKLVAVLRTKREDRGLQLIYPLSRCIRRYDIHELIITDEVEAGAGREVHNVAYLGFVEFDRGGVILAGDKVIIGDAMVGELVGFDETHAPNHVNILIRGPERESGMTRGLKLGAPVRFEPRPVQDGPAKMWPASGS